MDTNTIEIFNSSIYGRTPFTFEVSSCLSHQTFESDLFEPKHIEIENDIRFFSEGSYFNNIVE